MSDLDFDDDADAAGIGHNSKNDDDAYGIASDELRQFIERIEHLEAEKKDIAEQIKEVYAEAKGNGFDVKILRKVIRIRKMDAAERSTEEEMLDLYLSAVGSGR